MILIIQYELWATSCEFLFSFKSSPTYSLIFKATICEESNELYTVEKC